MGTIIIFIKVYLHKKLALNLVSSSHNQSLS